MAGFDTYNDIYNNGLSTGKNALNSFDPTSTANSTRGGFNSLYGSQTGTVNDLTSQYAGQIANNPRAEELYSTANDIFNVPNLQKNATYLNNQVTNAYPRALTNARGFDYSQGQVDNAVNQDLRFLQPQATAATANANTASGLASQWVNQGMAQNEINLRPIQSQIDLTNEAMARQSSGWTVAAEQEMQGLISKLNAGITLSSQEINRANELMKASQAYNQAIEVANIGKQSAMGVAQIGNQYKALDPAQTLVNTFTGGTYRAR